MNCQQVTRYIWDYCDHKLSPELGAAIESHCRVCPHCSQHLQLTVLENEALKNTSELPELSPGFTDRVMKNLPERDFALGKKPVISRLRSLSGRKRFMAASTAILGVLLVLLVVPGINHTGIIEFTQQSVAPPAPSQPEEQKYAGILGNAAIMNQANTTREVAPSEEKMEPSPSKSSSEDPEPSPPPAAYSTDSSSVSRGTTVNETASSPGWAEAPYSISLPGTYNLVNISTTPDNLLIYNFVQDKTDIVVDVIVSQVDDHKAGKGPLEAPSPGSISESNKSTVKALRDQSSNSEISWTVMSGNALYRLTLNGNLSPQELALLAGSVSFKVK